MGISSVAVFSDTRGAMPDESYRYDGPRPQTREAAIVMLADSAEAVARARQGEGAPSIDQVVDSR